MGKQADVAVWRLDTLPHADIVDPVAALVLGPRPPLELLLVVGRPVVERDRLVTADERVAGATAPCAHQRSCSPAVDELSRRTAYSLTYRK